MKHNEFLGALLIQYTLHVREELLVARGFHHILRTFLCLRLVLTNEDTIVRFAAEEVDVRMVGQLIGDEHGVESRLTERRNDALLVVQPIVVGSGSGREKHRNTLVSGVRL